LGIETSIILAGALREGTNHSLHATTAADSAVADAYAVLQPLMSELGRYVASTSRRDASPEDVGWEVIRLLALQFGTRPRRSLLDFQESGLERVTDPVDEVTAELFTRMGIARMLHVLSPDPTVPPSAAGTRVS